MRDNLGQFGFGKELKMQWINNSTGKIIDNPKLYDIDKASLGYGYSLTSNSLQIARAYSVFANEGVMVEPRILPDIQSKRVRVLSKSNALFILDSLRMTVLDGTASNLKNERVEIAGKTGTSQVRRITVAERESEDFRKKEVEWKKRDHALFVGYMPVENPRYAVSVVIEHGGSGASTAAPIAKEIFQFTKNLEI